MTLPKNRESRKQSRRMVALANLKGNIEKPLRKNMRKGEKPADYVARAEQAVADLETVIKNGSSGVVRTKKKRKDKRG